MERFVQRLLQVSFDLHNQIAEIHKLGAGRIGASLFAMLLITLAVFWTPRGGRGFASCSEPGF